MSWLESSAVMRALLLALVVLPALAGAQAIYTWVDAAGEEHFTDDPATIPANAARRTTTGEAISTIARSRGPDGGVASDSARPLPSRGPASAGTAPPRTRSRAQLLDETIARLEAQLEHDRIAVDQYLFPTKRVCGKKGCVDEPVSGYRQATLRLANDRAALARARADRAALEAGQ